MFLCYTRVSTQDQADAHATSLPEQERICRAFAAMKGAGPYDIAVYSDPGVSASVPIMDREEGDRLRVDMKAGDTVVAAKLDRMFRSVLDALKFAELCKKKAVFLSFIDFMGGDPVTGTGLAQCFFTIATAFAEFERHKINERTADGRRVKRARNGHLGGEPPYGYRVEGEGREARLVEIPEEMATITKLRQLMRECQPVNAWRNAEKMGLTCRSGRPFQIHQIQRIVKRFDQLEPLERVIYSEVA